ncbi:HlyD family efflux transporter periplasmic adaptor subunit [Planctomycetota bacterium]
MKKYSIFTFAIAALLIPLFCVTVTAKDFTELKVVKRDLNPELSLNGLVSPESISDIKLELKTFKSPLKVTKVIAPRTEVNQGDILVEFDLSDLETALTETRQILAEAKHVLTAARLDLKIFKEANPLHLARLEQDMQNGKQALKHFKDVLGPMELEAHEIEVKRTQFRLDNEREEMEQLEKMYRESDLAVDTQEIVLNRARRDIWFKEMALKHAEIRQRHFIEEIYPQKMRDLEFIMKNTGMTYRHTIENAGVAMAGKHEALAKAESKLVKVEQNLADLEADMAALEVRAPQSGIVIHYSLKDLIFSGRNRACPDRFDRIQTGDNLKPEQVIFSIYNPRQFQILIKLPEKHLGRFREGLTAECMLLALPDEIIKGEVSQIDLLPDGKEGNKFFWTWIRIHSTAPRLQPGMNVVVTVSLGLVRDVLSVPAAAVYQKYTDHYCKLATGKEVKVIPGISNDNHVEILSGLKEGDAVLVEVKENQ